MGLSKTYTRKLIPYEMRGVEASHKSFYTACLFPYNPDFIGDQLLAYHHGGHQNMTSQTVIL